METIHLLFLGFSAIFIALSDHLGLQYFLGKKSVLDTRTLNRYHTLVWIGLLGMIGSGIFLVWPALDYYLADTAFRLKMAFVTVLFVNGLFIGRLLKTATHIPYKELSGTKKSLLLLSGAASGIGWAASTLIGFFWL